MRSRLFGLLLLVLLFGGCFGPTDVPPILPQPIGRRILSIINGAADHRYPAVGAITPGTSLPFCTATLITPQLVVTAAHCVDAMGRYGGASACRFRTDSGAGQVHHIIQQAIKHPNYNPRSSSLSEYDIAVLILANKVNGVTPIPANADPITTAYVGKKVLVMGYGLIGTRQGPVRPQSKQSAEIPIFQVSGNTMIHYDQQTSKSACHGDSGGPALYSINGELRLIGVTSTAYKATKNPTGNPPTFCDGGTVDARPDAHYSSFLLQYITKYGGGCTNGQIKACYAGPAGTKGIGECKAGTQLCTGGKWGNCLGEMTPTTQEICNDQKDNNCNNQIDEGCGCKENQTRSCYPGPSNTQGVGVCKTGTETCHSGQWGRCEGAVTPSQKELCGDQKDNNCNNQTDEGCPTCQEGATDPCYTGPKETWNVGVCQAGVRTCRSGKWSATCENQVLPQNEEICGDQKDNNCNNQIDENCASACQEGTTRACYTGPQSARGKGICRFGSQRCAGGQWGQCTGDVHPKKEVCDDRTDNDCDGRIDEGCGGQNPNQFDPKTQFVARGSGCNSLPREPVAPLWMWGFLPLWLWLRTNQQAPKD